jgi:hypothetical protein
METASAPRKITAFTTDVVRAELLRRVLVVLGGIFCILYQSARSFKPPMRMVQLKIAFCVFVCYNACAWHIWSLSM